MDNEKPSYQVTRKRRSLVYGVNTTQYLRIHKATGCFVWEDHRPHGGRFSLAEAALLMRAAPLDATHTEAVNDTNRGYYSLPMYGIA